MVRREKSGRIRTGEEQLVQYLFMKQCVTVITLLQFKIKYQTTKQLLQMFALAQLGSFIPLSLSFSLVLSLILRSLFPSVSLTM